MNHRERAREIDETRDTKVELPVDYREVETVEVSFLDFLIIRMNSFYHFRKKICMATQEYVIIAICII